MQFIDLQKQLSGIRERIDARIANVLDHGQFILGPEVLELEEQLAQYAGVKHCITCANGTDALQLSLMAAGIGEGDIVFTTAFSFFATAEIIPSVGAKPWFVDIDIDTYNLSAEKLRQAIQQCKNISGLRPKAVIVADMFGLPADYPALQAVCKEFDLLLIEDAAQSFGGKINAKRCGSFGDIATTSFFPAKPLGCYGDGGAVFTNIDTLAECLKSLRVHGKGMHKYDNVRIGLNSRLDTLQAAILLEKLSIFPTELIARERIAKKYSNDIGAALRTPVVPHGYGSAWAQYSLRAENSTVRAKLQQKLSSLNIPTAIYYPVPLNKQPALLGSYTSDTPNTEIVCDSIFSLPMHPRLEQLEQDKIINALIE